MARNVKLNRMISVIPGQIYSRLFQVVGKLPMIGLFLSCAAPGGGGGGGVQWRKVMYIHPRKNLPRAPYHWGVQVCKCLPRGIHHPPPASVS